MPKQPKVNTLDIVKLYTTQHLTCAEIGKMFGMSRIAIWKRLQSFGVKSSEGTWVDFRCDECGVQARVNRSRWRKTAKHFCSMECYCKRMENPDYNPNRNGNRLARKAVGRVFNLLDGHIVHHEDGNNLNNQLSNLWVFASQAEHMSYHRGGKGQPIFKG